MNNVERGARRAIPRVDVISHCVANRLAVRLLLHDDDPTSCQKTAEALVQLSRLDEAIAARITEYRRIIAFRNILVHAYAQVDDRLVWDIVETSLPPLRREAAALLKE